MSNEMKSTTRRVVPTKVKCALAIIVVACLGTAATASAGVLVTSQSTPGYVQTPPSASCNMYSVGSGSAEKMFYGSPSITGHSAAWELVYVQYTVTNQLKQSVLQTPWRIGYANNTTPYRPGNEQFLGLNMWNQERLAVTVWWQNPTTKAWTGNVRYVVDLYNYWTGMSSGMSYQKYC